MWLCEVSSLVSSSSSSPREKGFSLDIVRDRSGVVAAEHSTHMHLIPNGRAYHGILSRISFLFDPIRHDCSLEKERKKKYPAIRHIFILHAVSGLDFRPGC